ncbi:MAG: terpene cyclase/mutase family protein [Vicinamibacterales bacterium]
MAHENPLHATAQESAHLHTRLRQRLNAATSGAGWGYYTGRDSRIEPTCWALLALAASDPDEQRGFAEPHLEWLLARQGVDGLLSDTEPGFANLTANAMAAIVLTRLGGRTHDVALRRLLDAIVAVKGVRLDAAEDGQNNTIQAWPWVHDTFSWVEPTAWCLLALKLAPVDRRPDGAALRMADAERLLLNRTCADGGWNYGNASTLGQDLRPYVPTTAAGLLAMQDRAATASVQQSVRRVSELRLSEPSSYALSLAAMALRLHGSPAVDVVERLANAVVHSEERGHLHAMAMALLALTADTHHMEDPACRCVTAWHSPSTPSHAADFSKRCRLPQPRLRRALGHRTTAVTSCCRRSRP